VPIVSAPAGATADVIDWYVDQGVDGLVIEGSGAGTVPAEVVPGVERAIRAGVPVVLATRVQNGFLSPTYGTGAASGGGFDLMRSGVIPSMYWRAPKARIALMVALGAGMPDGDLRELFRAP
jgi:L-asparaginase